MYVHFGVFARNTLHRPLPRFAGSLVCSLCLSGKRFSNETYLSKAPGHIENHYSDWRVWNLLSFDLSNFDWNNELIRLANMLRSFWNILWQNRSTVASFIWNTLKTGTCQLENILGFFWNIPWRNRSCMAARIWKQEKCSESNVGRSGCSGGMFDPHQLMAFMLDWLELWFGGWSWFIHFHRILLQSLFCSGTAVS